MFIFLFFVYSLFIIFFVDNLGGEVNADETLGVIVVAERVLHHHRHLGTKAKFHLGREFVELAHELNIFEAVGLFEHG